MSKLGPKNSVNVNIAIHMPNAPKTLNTSGLTIIKDGDEDEAESLRTGLNTVRFDDVVEISYTARKLAERRS